MTNWPDPARPGVPLNPDRNGAHKIGKYFVIWRSETQDYVNHNGNVLPPGVAYAVPYHGPCLTPAEIAAKADRIAELEAALDQLLDDMRDGLCVCQQAKDDARAALGGKNG